MIALSDSSQPMAPTGTILIVDDEPALLGIMAAILEDHGFACIKAARAAEALELLDANDAIDVVVSDLRMPKMDGVDFLRHLRNRFTDRSWLQFLFVTGHGSLDSAVEALRLDAIDFLHKPVRKAELIEGVERALAKSKREREAAGAWAQGQAQLSRLGDEIKRVSQMLNTAATGQGISIGGQDRQENDFPPHEVQSKSLPVKGENTLLEIIQAINLRNRHFEGELFTDPVWQMLLFLMENRIRDRDVYLTNLYQASGVPTATAARRFEELRKSGFVKCWRDSGDKRRQLVALTPEAATRIADYLSLLSVAK